MNDAHIKFRKFINEYTSNKFEMGNEIIISNIGFFFAVCDE